MTERLQKILSARGIASRRASESMIEAGRVTVNGVVAKLGQLADPETDTIFVDGRPLPSMENYVYIMYRAKLQRERAVQDEAFRYRRRAKYLKVPAFRRKNCCPGMTR